MQKKWRLKSPSYRSFLMRLTGVWFFTGSMMFASIPLDGDKVIFLFLGLSVFTTVQLFKLWRLEEEEQRLKEQVAEATEHLEVTDPWKLITSANLPLDCLEWPPVEGYKKEGQEEIPFTELPPDPLSS